MRLQVAAAAARRVGLGGLTDLSKGMVSRLPLRYHARSGALRFEGAWKHRVHLAAIEARSAEPLTLNRFVSALSPGATVLDVGAYLGMFTLAAAQAVGPGGRVIALEPDPTVFKHLAASVAYNGFSGRVELLNAAAAETPGVICLQQDRDGPSTSTTVTGAGLSVPAIRLGDLGVTPAVVKMDVEGAELSAIRGFDNLGAVDDLFVECNPSSLELGGATPEELVSLIRKSGLTEIVVIDEFEGSIAEWSGEFRSLYVNLHCTPT